MVVAGSVLLAAGAGGVAWKDSREIRRADEKRVAMTAALAASVEELHALRMRLAHAECEADTLRETLERLRAESAASAPETAAPHERSATTTTDSWVRALRRDPVVQALGVARDRTRAEVKYAALFKALGLSPVQVEKFLANLAARQEQSADLEAAAEAKDLADDDSAIMEGRLRIQREFEQAQRLLLGERGCQQMSEFDLTEPARDTVRGLAAVAVAAGVPLTVPQAEQLAQVLVSEGRRVNPEGWLSLSAADWTRIDPQARTILTEAQFVLFKTSDSGTGGMGSRFLTRLGAVVDRLREDDLRAKRGK